MGRCFSPCMPTVYIKQLKHYTQGGIRGSGEGNYTVKCVYYHLKNMSFINLLTLHTHFKYVLTNFVTITNAIMPITTNIVSSNPTQVMCTLYNIM